MKVRCKVKTITEKEIDLEYPYYLYFQDEMCQDELVKVFPDYEIAVKYETFGLILEKRRYPFYEEHQIINNLTSEEHFNVVFEEAMEQLIELKSKL